LQKYHPTILSNKNYEMASDNTKTVAVIGAGIAGLVTAKTLAQDGFDVQVFEKGNDLGGTWALSRTYPGLRTNNTKQTYEFSDHPYPDDTELSPRADEVRSYLESGNASASIQK
jgi:dimethylaniline monooxygenase (N-oxide forming)